MLIYKRPIKKRIIESAGANVIQLADSYIERSLGFDNVPYFVLVTQLTRESALPILT